MAITPVPARTPTAVTITEEIETKVNGLDTNAKRIRFLSGCGYTTNQISKILNIRYQWVRNVLNTPLKKAQ